MYIWLFSRSVGAGSATTRNTRGLTRSVIALIVPPLPAPSRPSKTMQTLSPLCTIHCCSLTSSTCRRSSSRLYSLRVRPVDSLSLAFSAGFCLRFIDVTSFLLLVFERFGGDLAVKADEPRDERLEFRIPRGQPLCDAGVLEHE